MGKAYAKTEHDSKFMRNQFRIAIFILTHTFDLVVMMMASNTPISMVLRLVSSVDRIKGHVHLSSSNHKEPQNMVENQIGGKCGKREKFMCHRNILVLSLVVIF